MNETKSNGKDYLSCDNLSSPRQENKSVPGINADKTMHAIEHTSAHPCLLETPLQALLRHALERPDAIALITDDNEEWSYRRLANEVSALSNGLLRNGIRSGDRIVLSVSSSPLFAVFMFTAMMTGTIVVALKLELTARELNEFFARLRPALYIRDAELNDVRRQLDLRQTRAFSSLDIGPDSWRNLSNADLPANPILPVNIDATFLLLTTSGTTGMPKLVAYNQRIMAHVFEGASDYFNHNSCVIAPSEVAHISGSWTMLASITSGGRAILINHATADTLLDKIEQYECTYLFLPPFLVSRMVEAQRKRSRNMSSLRACRIGGDACRPHMAEAFEETFNLSLENAYGMTECINSTLPGADFSTVCGKPGCTKLLNEQGEEVAFGDVGELYVSGPTVSQGYWISPGEITTITRNGWLATGDLMQQEPNGDYRLVGRCKDLIVVKGVNISPLEVENQLVQFPAISDAAIVGVPDDTTGQRVIALVKLTEPAAAEDILDWLAQRIAAYKLPHQIRTVNNIPRNAMGKVDRRAIVGLALKSQETKSSILMPGDTH